MGKRWYYQRDGLTSGPVSGADLIALIDSGRLGPENLICLEGTDKWSPISSLRRRESARRSSESAGSEATHQPSGASAPHAQGRELETSVAPSTDDPPHPRWLVFDAALTILVLLSVVWYVFTEIVLNLAAGPLLRVHPVLAAFMGLPWIGLGARYASAGHWVTWRGRYRKLKSHGAAGGMMILFGLVITCAPLAIDGRPAWVRQLIPPPRPTFAKVESFVREQFRREQGRPPEALSLRPTGPTTYVGVARLGADAWDVMLDTNGWVCRMVPRQGPGELPGKQGGAGLPEYVADPAATGAYEARDGTFSLRFVPDRWQRVERPTNPVAESQFSLRNADGHAMLIKEREQVELSPLVQAAVARFREAGSDVRVLTQERRRVNGQEVACLIAAMKVEGLELTFYCYYHTGKAGTLQLLTWSPSSRFAAVKPDLEKFLNGLVVTGESP